MLNYGEALFIFYFNYGESMGSIMSIYRGMWEGVAIVWVLRRINKDFFSNHVHKISKASFQTSYQLKF